MFAISFALSWSLALTRLVDLCRKGTPKKKQARRSTMQRSGMFQAIKFYVTVSSVPLVACDFGEAALLSR